MRPIRWLSLVPFCLLLELSFASASPASEPATRSTEAPATEARPTDRLPQDRLPEQWSTAKMLGLSELAGPSAPSAATSDQARLGRKLFFDARLSRDGTLSCASCHDPSHGFASPDPRAIGVAGRTGERHAPALVNRGFGKAFFWDGREATLESQALRPVENPLELDLSLAEMLTRLEADGEYKSLFEKTFPDGLTTENVARAIAEFERLIVIADSPVDRFLAGEVERLSESARQGLWLFESKAGCWKCHSGPNFTDEAYHNTGVNWGKTPLDAGRQAVTKSEEDRGRFKTPTLRGIARSAPYMHDGGLASLADVVEFYNQGGVKNPRLDPVIKPLGLSSSDKEHLVAFLEAVSGRFAWEDAEPERP